MQDLPKCSAYQKTRRGSSGLRIVISLLLAGLLLNCNKSEDASPVSGTVVDAFSNTPVQGAEIALLEEGPVTMTDGQGRFAISKEMVGQLPESDKITFDGTQGIAVGVTHPDYRPLEANLKFNTSGTLQLVRKSVPVFLYHQPVQLNDGIVTGTLDDGGMDNQVIQNLMDKIHGGDFKQIHSLLVYRKGKLILEEYFFGNNDTIRFEHNVVVDRTPPPVQWTRTGKHYVASVNKSLTSTLVGIALDQKGLSVETKIAPYLPDYAAYFADPDKAAITFGDCLTMTAGFQWDEWGANDLSLLWQSEDFADFLLSRNSLGVDAEWRYCSALPNLLLKAVDNMIGSPVRDWAMTNFYQKLGITDLNWQSQPDGYPEGAARMFIRPRDLLKIGITYLNHGRWDETQVVPSAWVDACMQVKEATEFGDYSYYFWLRHLDGIDYLSADGDGGNYVNIIPSLDMVIVVTQGNYLLWPFYVDQVDAIMQDYLFPAAG